MSCSRLGHTGCLGSMKEVQMTSSEITDNLDCLGCHNQSLGSRILSPFPRINYTVVSKTGTLEIDTPPNTKTKSNATFAIGDDLASDDVELII
jgi:hypothetical protein